MRKKFASVLLALGMVLGFGAVNVVAAAPASAASYAYCHNHYGTATLSGNYTVQYCKISYTVAERWNRSDRPYGWNWYSRTTWTSRWGYAVNPSWSLSYHTPHSGYWH